MNNQIPKNYVKFGDEAIAGLMKGMEVTHRAVSSTMGAAGRNVIHREYGFIKGTNDGLSIAREINLADQHEAMGADWITQVAERTVQEVGDATSTAIVLAYAMVQEGLKKIRSGANPMRLRKEILGSVAKITETLKKKSKKITTDEELFNIANISVENSEIAGLIKDAAKHSGLDGDIIVEQSRGTTVELKKVEGFKIQNGFSNPLMVTNPRTMEAVFENCAVIVTDKGMNLNKDAFKLLEALVKEGRNRVLLIADDVSGELLSTILANRMQQTPPIHVVVVKKPYYLETLEDIAVLTGATTLTNAKGVKELGAEHLSSVGVAKKVVVTKDSCLIVGKDEYKEAVEERIATIKHALKQNPNSYDEKVLKDRLAHLSGAVSVISVGAPTDADMKYLKDKVDDAVHAVKAALEEGVVLGGGRALYDISLGKPENDGDEVVRNACGQPIRCIIENSGENTEQILASLKAGEAFNVFTAEVCADPFKEGLIDPLKAERCALANAANFASLFLTTGTVIVEIPKSVEKVEN
jgi:chaperonin GroEL